MKKIFTTSIIKAVSDVFSTMIFLNPKNETPFKKNGSQIKSSISGIMGLTGSITASIIIHFEEKVALKATSNMINIEYTKIDEDVSDAVGEITNMIAGAVKADIINLSNIELNLSLPTVVSGSSFKTQSIDIKENVVIPFEIDEGKFYVEFSFKEN